MSSRVIWLNKVILLRIISIMKEGNIWTACIPVPKHFHRNFIPETDWIKLRSPVWKTSIHATSPGINLWYLKNKMYFVLLFCLLHISVVFIASKEINGLYEKEVPWRLMEWEISYNWWSRKYYWDWWSRKYICKCSVQRTMTNVASLWQDVADVITCLLVVW